MATKRKPSLAPWIQSLDVNMEQIVDKHRRMKEEQIITQINDNHLPLHALTLFLISDIFFVFSYCAKYSNS